MTNDLAKLSNTVALNEYTYCQVVKTQGKVTLMSPSAYLLLFVLQGEVKLNTNNGSVEIRNGNFIAVRTASLREMICGDNTILLEYTPVKLVCSYFESCNRGFGAPFSSVVHILPPVDQWIEKIIGPDTKIVDHAAVDVALAKILVDYPNHCLGELYVPFYAFYLHMGNLKK